MTDVPQPAMSSNPVPAARRPDRAPLHPSASAGAPVGPVAIDTVAVAVSVALLAATVVLSSLRVRADGELDWSNLLLGLAATVGLLAVAAAAHVVVSDPRRRAVLVAWPGAFGALAAGLLLAAVVDTDWVAYLSGLLIVALSVAGLRFLVSPAYVVSGVLGLFVLYAKVCDDGFDALDLEGNDNVGLVVGGLLLVFAVLVTALGWLLPTRVYSGVVAGVIAAAGYVLVLFGLTVAASFAGAFGSDGSSGRSAYDGDVWWILVFSVLLVALWAGCAWVTGHVAFRLLIVGLVVPVVPLATTVLAVEHPTWWELALGVVGGGLLVAVLARARGRRDDPAVVTAAPTDPTDTGPTVTGPTS